MKSDLLLLGALGACSALDVHVCSLVDDDSALGGAADGSEAHPFGSVERARDLLRAHPRRLAEHHRVLLRGVHALRRPFALDARDAGTADATVTYTSWQQTGTDGGGSGAAGAQQQQQTPAQMTGGVVLPASAFVPAGSAAPHPGVLVADLLAHGVNASSLGALGHPYPTKKLELFYGGKPMDLARDPNIGTDALRTWHWAGYENATGPVGNATGATSVGFADGARAARWAAATADAAHGADLWLHGYFKFDWRDTFVRVAKVDVAGAELVLDSATPPQYEAIKGCRFYAVNALPLLDAAGEYFVDAQAGKLYFLPPGGSGRVEQQVLVSVLPAVLAVDGANHTSFEGLTITAAQGTVATLSNVASVFVRNSTVSNGGSGCLGLHGADSAVEGCSVFGCGSSGISIVGGSVKTLERGNLSVTGS
jgi:hypothetical protein